MAHWSDAARAALERLRKQDQSDRLGSEIGKDLWLVVDTVLLNYPKDPHTRLNVDEMVKLGFKCNDEKCTHMFCHLKLTVGDYVLDCQTFYNDWSVYGKKYNTYLREFNKPRTVGELTHLIARCQACSRVVPPLS